jgi:DNA polymerase-3 subunit epsilon
MPQRPDLIAVIDFETTGMGPSQGARATEIACVLVQDGRIVDRYQSLMKTGVWVPPFITALTGISNAMLRDAPPAEQVMREVAAFTCGVPLVAHNAAFDRGFWAAEMAHADLPPDPAHAFACTVLLSRRLYPEAPSHKLSALAEWLGLQRDGRAHRAMSDADVTAQLLIRLQRDGRAHRAMSDADVTAQLLIRLQRDVTERFAAQLGPRSADHALLSVLQRAQRQQLPRCVERHLGAAPRAA